MNPCYTRYHLELGEISSYPPGYKENGSVFCHNNPWIVCASAEEGLNEFAWKIYKKNCPAYLENVSEIHRTEPYVYSQTIAGRDAQNYGEAKNSFLTGTASWTFVAASQAILGIKPDYDGLLLKPCLPKEIKDVSITRYYRGKKYNITKEMLPIVEKYLKTPSGFRLCSEHDLSLCGAKSSATDHYFIGDRENGGVFKHATMMLVVGLLQAARNVKDPSLKKSLLDNTYYMLDIVMPFRTYEDIQKYKGNPRFCTQYNNSLTEENIGPMLSGTATWLTLALYEIIGISFIDNGFRINPSLRYEESHFEAKIKHLNSIFSIIINKTPNSVGKNNYDIFVDGNPHTGPIYPDGNNHTIVINY